MVQDWEADRHHAEALKHYDFHWQCPPENALSTNLTPVHEEPVIDSQQVSSLEEPHTGWNTVELEDKSSRAVDPALSGPTPTLPDGAKLVHTSLAMRPPWLLPAGISLHVRSSMSCCLFRHRPTTTAATAVRSLSLSQSSIHVCGPFQCASLACISLRAFSGAANAVAA